MCRRANKDAIFAKVKGLISDVVAKLEAEAEADATEKALCDKELAETTMVIHPSRTVCGVDDDRVSETGMADEGKLVRSSGHPH